MAPRDTSVGSTPTTPVQPLSNSANTKARTKGRVDRAQNMRAGDFRDYRFFRAARLNEKFSADVMT
jgi:hypothetical protein